MTFDSYWDAHTEKNPPLAHGDTKITISAYELKRQLRKAFEAGKRCDDPFPDFFDMLRAKR